MESRNASDEMKVDSVLEDFEEGDKMHFFYKKSSRLNREISGIAGLVEDNFMWVYISGIKESIQVGKVYTEDDDPHYVGQWRKIPDDTLIQVGDIMSTTHVRWTRYANSREFFTVVEIVPGQKIALQSHDDPDFIARIHGSHSLDEYLKEWVMEG